MRVLVVGLFILTFLAQNFVIPSGSMEKTLLVGITCCGPPYSGSSAKWMPLEHYASPRRAMWWFFIKPSPEPTPDADGKPQYLFLVKR